jgi:hypothetical protein
MRKLHKLRSCVICIRHQVKWGELLVKRKIGETQHTPVGKYNKVFMFDSHLGEHLSGDILN